jgi:hypothetical protein
VNSRESYVMIMYSTHNDIIIQVCPILQQRLLSQNNRLSTAFNSMMSLIDLYKLMAWSLTSTQVNNLVINFYKVDELVNVLHLDKKGCLNC